MYKQNLLLLVRELLERALQNNQSIVQPYGFYV